MPKRFRIRVRRIRQDTAQDRADNDTDIKAHRQENEGPRLVFLLPHSFTNPIMILASA